jgi:hypothetical protein
MGIRLERGSGTDHHRGGDFPALGCPRISRATPGCLWSSSGPGSTLCPRRAVRRGGSGGSLRRWCCRSFLAPPFLRLLMMPFSLGKVGLLVAVMQHGAHGGHGRQQEAP